MIGLRGIKKMVDGNLVVKCWRELNDLEAFSHNKELLYQSPQYIIEPVMETGLGFISDDPSENVNLRYWYEILVPYRRDLEDENEKHTMDPNPIGWMHIWKLDDGAESYEQAILDIHAKMTKEYGGAHVYK